MIDEPGLVPPIFSVAITLIAFAVRPWGQSGALPETRRPEWVHDPAELRRFQKAVHICATSGRKIMDSKWQDVALTRLAAVLLAAGLWANIGGSSLQHVRGAWIVHAMR